MKYFAVAIIKTDDGTKPLVKKSGIIYQAPTVKFKSLKIIGPFAIFSLLFLVVLFVSIRQFMTNKMKYWIDYIVYGVNGFMGVAILWFVIFSEHPAMRPNYNLLWAVPINLVFAIAWAVKKWRPKIKYYHVIISGWLILVVLTESFLPQKFHPAHYLLILIVLSRSVLNSLVII